MADCDISVTAEETQVYEITLPTDNPIYVDTGCGGGIGGGVLGSLTWGTITNKPIIVLNETPVGNIDGINTIFSTNAPVMDLAIWIFLNGLRLTLPNYTLIDASTIELVDPPFIGDILIVDYVKAGSGGGDDGGNSSDIDNSLFELDSNGDLQPK